jgi:hypothetical protein
MPEQKNIPVTLASVRDPVGKIAPGIVEYYQWSQQERFSRALKTLGIFWGLSAASVILPILHFFLVPGFFLAGVAMFFWIRSQSEVLLGGRGTCPECGKDFEVVRAPVRWPIRDLCSHCRCEVEISPRERRSP